MATALGLAQTLAIPFAGISGLDALVHPFAFPDGYVAAVMDAHRSQVYYGEYVCRHGRIGKSKKSCLLNISDLERYLADRHTYIVGDLKACLPNALKPGPAEWPRPIDADLFLAASIGRLALLRKRNWRLGKTIIAEPMYIRPPDAIKNKGKKR